MEKLPTIGAATAFLCLLMAPSLPSVHRKTMAMAQDRAIHASTNGIQPPPPGINSVAISMEKPPTIEAAQAFLSPAMAASLPSVPT